MGQFREFCEVSDVVEVLAETFLNEAVDDLGAGIGDFAKGIGKGFASPIAGLWHAGRRFWSGNDSVDRVDAEREFQQSKLSLLKSLMSMQPEVRSQEISKLVQSLDTIKNINNYDPQARDSGLARLLQRGTYKGFANPNYKKLAGM